MIEGLLAQRTLSDGRVLGIEPLTFGRARLHVGYPRLWWWDDSW